MQKISLLALLLLVGLALLVVVYPAIPIHLQTIPSVLADWRKVDFSLPKKIAPGDLIGIEADMSARIVTKNARALLSLPLLAYAGLLICLMVTIAVATLRLLKSKGIVLQHPMFRLPFLVLSPSLSSSLRSTTGEPASILQGSVRNMRSDSMRSTSELVQRTITTTIPSSERCMAVSKGS